MQNDPLNDAMSVMKNASSIGKGECIIQPSSKLIGRVLKVMQDNGYAFPRIRPALSYSVARSVYK